MDKQKFKQGIKKGSKEFLESLGVTVFVGSFCFLCYSIIHYISLHLRLNLSWIQWK